MARGRKVGPGSFLKVSPAKFIGAIVGGVSNMAAGRAAMDRAEDLQRSARTQLTKQRTAYEGLDTSNLAANVVNPYANIQTQFENTFEDLTVNQQQAQFQAQQGAQQRANIMGQMRGAAGSSGIAGLAQALASQGQLQTQRISASIGQQEARNQALAAQGAASVQMAERQGEQWVQQAQMDRQATLLGMQAGQATGANLAHQQAQANQMQAEMAQNQAWAEGISSIVGTGVGADEEELFPGQG